jgi:hypothetical protein
MARRLFVGVLGKRKAGKTTTFDTLFGREVRTRGRPEVLPLGGGEYVDVYLVSSSNEERKAYAKVALKRVQHRIILCAIGYEKSVEERTLDWIIDHKFHMYVQWLNPGYNKPGYLDHLGLQDRLLGAGATFAIRNANVRLRPRVEEIRQFIYGWAKYNKLIYRMDG